MQFARFPWTTLSCGQTLQTPASSQQGAGGQILRFPSANPSGNRRALRLRARRGNTPAGKLQPKRTGFPRNASSPFKAVESHLKHHPRAGGILAAAGAGNVHLYYKVCPGALSIVRID